MATAAVLPDWATDDRVEPSVRSTMVPRGTLRLGGLAGTASNVAEPGAMSRSYLPDAAKLQHEGRY